MTPLIAIALFAWVRAACAAPSTPTASPPDGGPRSSRAMPINVTARGLENVERAHLEMTSTEQDQRRLSSRKCKGNEKYLLIDIKTDNYGFENSWRILKDTKRGPREIHSGPPPNKNYEKQQRYAGGYCLEPGVYKFVMSDLFKDGMCCAFGRGKYAGYVNSKRIFSSPDGDEDWERRGHGFTIPDAGLPPQARMGLTARDREWLASHNSRRREWHELYDKTYVPVKWSDALEKRSRIWAEKLAEDCKLVHDPDNEFGENIALNYGWGSWGERRPTENILTRFVEDEANDRYPENGHFTQVLWRATKYVGCADASRPYDGGTCHTQVCRYSKPGNCNMGNYKSRGEWWLTPMLRDDSPCGEECPPDGCS